MPAHHVLDVPGFTVRWSVLRYALRDLLLSRSPHRSITFTLLHLDAIYRWTLLLRLRWMDLRLFSLITSILIPVC